MSDATETAVEAPLNLQAPTPKPKRGNVANLKRYPKGTKPPQLTPGRVGPNRRSLDKVIAKALESHSYALLEELGASIIQGAIEREPACLAFLAPRLWPLEQGQSGGRIISEGIRLEVVDGKASVTVLKQSVSGQTGELNPSEEE